MQHKRKANQVKCRIHQSTRHPQPRETCQEQCNHINTLSTGEGSEGIKEMFVASFTDFRSKPIFAQPVFKLGNILIEGLGIARNFTIS